MEVISTTSITCCSHPSCSCNSRFSHLLRKRLNIGWPADDRLNLVFMKSMIECYQAFGTFKDTVNSRTAGPCSHSVLTRERTKASRSHTIKHHEGKSIGAQDWCIPSSPQVSGSLTLRYHSAPCSATQGAFLQYAH